MNILQLTSHFSPNVGGVETHLDDLVTALVKRNHKVFVLTYRPLTTKAKWKMYETRNRGLLKILRIPWFPGHFYELVNHPIFEFLYLIPGIFLSTPFVILSTNPKVVHAHGIIAGVAGVFWGKFFRKRVVISTHSIYHFPPTGIYTSFIKVLFKHADVILCLSQQSADEIKKLGIPESQVKVFTYWIDLEKFKRQPKAKESIELSNRFVVLFVGRLIKEKGVAELIESAKKWNTNITLLIAGTGPLEEYIQEQEDKKRFIYAGKVSQEKLPFYYSAADILMVPSIHEEGFGRVMLESLACGTPVVAAKRGGIIEAINEKVGYLIDITPENIKKVVEYCYNHRVELENKSKQAHRLAKRKYSEENIDIIISSYK